ncbi:class I SAM-dependent methyltransferase [Massilia sp. DWR3-1-1]|uniref:class I SAM-dependent methyltransferase n=1 Tax=Massilia sp. DWR3-1-1 TaxID=2804559 RepID=UPI003CF46239
MAHERHFSDAAATWDARFGGSDFLFGSAPNAYLASQRGLLAAGASALAVADGDGRNSVWLAQQGLRVDAFDISPVGVAKASAMARTAGVEVNLQVADCEAWNWQADAYDVVVAIFVQFADPAMRARLFENMVATLKPGGYLIVQGYTPAQLDYKTGGPGVRAHLYTGAMLREAFAALKILDLREYDAVLAEGSAHRGRSALLGMVARKRQA